MTYVTALLLLSGLSLLLLVWEVAAVLWDARPSAEAREQLEWWAGS